MEIKKTSGFERDLIRISIMRYLEPINPMEWYREIRWAYQRVRRGYDDRIMWGFDSHFEEIVMPPLKEFCEEQLSDLELMDMNKRRRNIYRKTLKLIKDYKDMKGKDFYDEENTESKLWEYVGKHIGYYWD